MEIPPRLSLVEEQQPAERIVLDRENAPQLAHIGRRNVVAQASRRESAIAEVRELAEPIVIRTQMPVGAGLSVAGTITVEEASTLRLRFEGSASGVVVWLAGEHDEEFERFEPGIQAHWSPTTKGATVYVATAGGTADLTLASLAIGSTSVDAGIPACMLDAACAADAPPELAEASRAIARLHVVRGDASHVCTGALLNDSSNSGTGFLLTARHCVSTAEEAASIEVIWDDRSTSCGSSGKRTTPRSYGAELLVSSADTDMALLRLTKVPLNRVFLGVSAADLPAGTKTYRVSHAAGAPQSFVSGAIDDQGLSCGTAPRPQFLYSTQVHGAVASGSSGSPLLTAGLFVVGQLSGRCGSAPEDACSAGNVLVDGSMQASWPMLEPFLNAPSGGRRRHATRH